jgi:hypothetical protein
MAHHEHEQALYHRRGCIICEINHRLYILEGEFDAMSQAWEEQESRFARDVSELKSKFDTLNTKVGELTSQVDSAEATQAAEYAADFKASLDQFEEAFGLGSSGESGAPSEPAPVEPPAGGEVTDPTPPVEPSDPSSGSGEGESSGGGEATDGPHVDNSLPEPEAPPEPGVPDAPVPDPNDPNAGAPSAPPESPGSDPTIPVPGSEE